MKEVSRYPSKLALFARIAVVSIILAILFVSYSLTRAQSATFRNPLNNGGADPWMTYYNGNYYLATTTWGGPSVGLTMRKAPTIAALKNATPVRIWQDSTASRCCNYWAPEFHLLNGPNGTRWYMYFTGGASGTNYTVTQHIHVLESAGTDPMGPYTYKAQLVSRVALDGSILQLNGSLYAIYGVWDSTQNIYIAPMSNPWTISGNAVMISSPTFDWERQDGNVNEGPEALQHNGRTFIIYSASACWGPNYKLGQLTLTGSNPLSASSWTKKSTPVFQQGNAVFGPGHNGFFKSPDGTEDWIVYHANSSASGGCDLNRTTRIQKFTWNADGSPNFGSPVSTSTNLAVPSGESGGTGSTNLAQGRTASADSAQSANPAASGNDGSTSTRWSAANGNTGHWWKVDLGSARNLTGSEVMWEFSGRVYKYRVEVSTDNNNWTLVVDKTNNTSTAQTQRDSFTATASIITVHQFTGVILIMSDFEGIRAHLTAKRAWRGRGITIYDYHAPSPEYWNPCQSSGWRS